MATDTELRSRVTRLLRGEFRVEDLTRLFLWLRDRSDGAASVREIGDFVAHSDQREKGLVTEELRRFFGILRFKNPQGAPIELADVPAEFLPALKRNLRRIPRPLIKRETGLKKEAAESALGAALSKFHPNGPGRASLKIPLTNQEHAVMSCAYRHLTPLAPFNAHSLVRDFEFALKKNNLLDTKDKAIIGKLKSPLVLYAMAAMHHTRILLEQGQQAELFAGLSESAPSTLEVHAIAPAWPVKGGGGSLLVSSPLFTTDLSATEWCSPDLIDQTFGGRWHCAIEVNSEPKLVVLDNGDTKPPPWLTQSNDPP